MTSIKEALEPCPFCGSAHLESGGDDKLVGVRCLDCEATGPNHYITGKDWNIRSSVGVSSNAIDALEHARMFIENGVELGYIKMPDADTLDPAHKTLSKIIAALATLQPSGEGREAIARAIAAYNEVWNGWPELEAKNVDECREEAMKAALLASGLVQNEAGIRRDEREKCASEFLVPVTGIELQKFVFNEKTIKDSRGNELFIAKADVEKLINDRAAAIRSARDGGES